MPTLRRQLSMANQSGFSLVEVLVVLVIIGLMSTMVVMNIKPSNDDKLKFEALNALLNETANRSILSGRVHAVGLSQDGYEVYQFRENKWQLLQQNPWPEIENTIKIELMREQALLSLPKKMSFSKKNTPVLWFDPTGFSTDFELKLYGKNTLYKINSNGNGQTVLQQSAL